MAFEFPPASATSTEQSNHASIFLFRSCQSSDQSSGMPSQRPLLPLSVRVPCSSPLLVLPWVFLYLKDLLASGKKGIPYHELDAITAWEVATFLATAMISHLFSLLYWWLSKHMWLTTNSNGTSRDSIIGLMVRLEVMNGRSLQSLTRAYNWVST